MALSKVPVSRALRLMKTKATAYRKWTIPASTAIIPANFSNETDLSAVPLAADIDDIFFLQTKIMSAPPNNELGGAGSIPEMLE
jgi:hypothetical protein